MLKEREQQYRSFRLTELKEHPVDGKLDLEHLKEINAVCSRMCAWAGQPREKFDAAKQAYEGEKPMPPHRLRRSTRKPVASSASWPTTIISADSHVKTSVPALAKLYGELNQLHTFLEGNGRTQRLFLEQLAERAGHRVDLSIGTQHRIIEASIAQTNGLHSMMERFITEAADPQRVKPCEKP